MAESTDLAPWAHPKAQRWFESLIDDTSFALVLEDELVQAKTIPGQTPDIQRMCPECAEKQSLQRQPEEEEEELQAKSKAVGPGFEAGRGVGGGRQEGKGLEVPGTFVGVPISF